MVMKMITRTEHGYALEGWEGRMQRLSNGYRATSREVMVAVCAVIGMSQKETARELGCSDNNIKQVRRSILHKTGTKKIIVAVQKLIDEGALHRLQVLLLALMLGTSGVTGVYSTTDFDSDTDTQTEMPSRSGRARGTRIARRASGKRGRGSRITGASSLVLVYLDYWTGGNAGDIYTHADVQRALS